MKDGQLAIGIAGLGTVGKQVAQAILNGALPGVVLSHVVVRDTEINRGLDLRGVQVGTDLQELVAADNSIDLVVELIGGENGPALGLVKSALSSGKSVVTANKAMLARHSIELATLADEKNQILAFEAAVAGGIPIIKTIREALAGNKVTRLSGILNGTCNFILSKMAETGGAFEDILAQAQSLGYAEADPSFDIEGIDAAQKLTLLAGLAFGITPDLTSVSLRGITDITARDISASSDFKCSIRLIAKAESTDGSANLWVGPALLRRSHPLYAIDGVTNAVVISAEPVGELMLQGPGAGGGATASAVLGDIADIAGGFGRSLFSQPVQTLIKAHSENAQLVSAWYLRFLLADTAGSMASVTQILAKNGVSIEEAIQRAPNVGETHLPVVFITHVTPESAVKKAIDEVKELSGIAADVLCLPVFTE